MLEYASVFFFTIHRTLGIIFFPTTPHLYFGITLIWSTLSIFACLQPNSKKLFILSPLISILFYSTISYIESEGNKINYAYLNLINILYACSLYILLIYYIFIIPILIYASGCRPRDNKFFIVTNITILSIFFLSNLYIYIQTISALSNAYQYDNLPNIIISEIGGIIALFSAIIFLPAACGYLANLNTRFPLRKILIFIATIPWVYYSFEIIKLNLHHNPFFFPIRVAIGFKPLI